MLVLLSIFKRFFEFCGKVNKRKFYLSLVYGTAQAFFEAIKIPAAAMMITALLNEDVSNQAIWGSFGLMLIGIIGCAIVKYRATMLQTEAGYGTCANKRIEIAEHLRYLPMGYFNKNSLGYITSVTTNTMESLSDVATRVVMMATQGILTTLVITLMVFLFDWRIGCIILVGVGLFLMANRGLQHQSKKLIPLKDVSDSHLVEVILEYLQGILEVKSYQLVGKTAKKINQAIDENVKCNFGCEIHFIPFMCLQNFITKMTGVMMCAMSLIFYIQGSMSLINCIMMMIGSFMLYSSLDAAGNYSSLLRQVDISVSKASAILALEPMDISGRVQHPVNHDIDLEHVSFSYEQRKIIDDVSIHIPEKTTTAIIGPSGGGKSTLCKLMSRFWDVQKGSVKLGGINVKDYSMDSLMSHFSFVFQNVYLFQDTVANNIRFGQPEAPMEKVIEAAKKACCHEFIMNLPQGYETVIGEGGTSLSGGEKQRLSIARAIMKDAPIIILDEATANVDPENERELVTAVRELTKEKTILMIAHRLKTVRHADQILVVDQGKIVQKGNHEELMKQEGIYRRFIQTRELAVGWKL